MFKELKRNMTINQKVVLNKQIENTKYNKIKILEVKSTIITIKNSLDM